MDRRLDRWLGSHSVTRLIPPSPCRQTRRQPQHRAMPQRAQAEMIRDQAAKPPAIPGPTHVARIGLRHSDGCERSGAPYEE